MKMIKRNGIWYADLRSEGMGRKSTGKTDKQEAMQEVVLLLSNPEPAVPAFGTMRVLLNRAVEEYYLVDHPKGKRQHLSVMRRLLQDWGSVPVNEVDTPRLSAYMKELRESGLKGGTVNRIMSYLRKTLVLAVEWGELGSVPQVPRMKDGGERHYEFTDADIDALMRATEGSDIQPLIVFLLHTGCRLGEAMHISAIDRQRALSKGDWHIPVSKTSKSRTLPLDSPALLALQWWTWRDMSIGQIQRAWCRATYRCGKMGVNGWVIHSLRHTFASRALQNGADLKAVSEYLGHSSIRMTERYARINSNNLKSVVGLAV